MSDIVHVPVAGTDAEIRPRHLWLRLGLVVVSASLLVAAGATVVSGVSAVLVRSRLDRVKTDWVALRKGFQAYGMDRCGAFFPPDTQLRCREESTCPLTFECSVLKAREWAERKAVGTFWSPLTTPIAYMTTLPQDPFRPGEFYGYTCWNYTDRGPLILAVLHSPGPDGVNNCDLRELRKQLDVVIRAERTRRDARTPEIHGVLRQLVRPWLYDPTNGLKSSGDLLSIYDNNAAYGWGANEGLWATAPEPDRPFSYEEYCSLLPEEPAGVTAEQLRMRQMQVPPHFQELARALGTDLAVLPTAPEMTSEMALLHGRFGADFAAFFESPHVLRPDELLRFTKWQNEAPTWWNRIRSCGLGGVETQWPRCKELQIYEFLPYYGKSQLLAAACEAATGERDQALRRIEYLRSMLDHVSGGTGKPRTDFEVRVQTELPRLSGLLERAIAGRH